MNEEFLHYIWHYALYDSSDLVTTCGKRISVISPGQHNRDAGPDFLEAKLMIDKVLWAGHVEIHINSRDWEYHKHQLDSAYDPVILHVVYTADKQISNSEGTLIPTLELKINLGFFSRYQQLQAELKPIPCGLRWQDLSPVKVENAVVAMGIERMEKRMESLSIKLKENKGAWKELFLQTISRGFGFGKNQHSMEILGKSINPDWVKRHNANLFQLESLFFGQSGLLPEKHSDPYLSSLSTEFNYLKRKYNISPPLGIRWKYLRMRPGNFPAVRLAQLCSFFHEEDKLIDRSLEIATSSKLNKIEIHTSSYWKSHYDIDKKSSKILPDMGDSSKLLLMINVFLPLNAFFNDRHGASNAIESWLEHLEQLPAEDNRVTRQWQEIGFRIPNAFYSQSFFYVYRDFCVTKKCLTCKIGQLIMGTEK